MAQTHSQPRPSTLLPHFLSLFRLSTIWNTAYLTCMSCISFHTMTAWRRQWYLLFTTAPTRKPVIQRKIDIYWITGLKDTHIHWGFTQTSSQVHMLLILAEWTVLNLILCDRGVSWPPNHPPSSVHLHVLMEKGLPGPAHYLYKKYNSGALRSESGPGTMGVELFQPFMLLQSLL